MFIGEEQEWAKGEENAWQRLAASVPAEVCRRTGACFDEYSGTYFLDVFNVSVAIYCGRREIRGTGDLCNLLRSKLRHFSRLSILWYMVQAQDIPSSGSLIHPRELDGGLIFTQGSHILPLDKLALKYQEDMEGFMNRGKTLGGEFRKFGDSSIMLYPFPRVPVLLVLWLKEEEYPARAQLLFDATCPHHLPTDIIWSTAMMSITVML